MQRAARGIANEPDGRAHRVPRPSPCRIDWRTVALAIWIGAGCFHATRAHADAQAPPPAIAPSDAQSDAQVNAAVRPSLFVLGAQQVGMTAGYGNGASVTTAGAYEGHLVSELVLVSHWQIDVTRSPIEPAWYKGVLALRIEPSLLVNFEPRLGVAGGVAAMFRYRWTGFGDTIPYIEGGAGIIGLDFDLFEQADGLAFNPSAGAGIVRRLGEHWSADFEVRFQHISNAYTQFPNGGFDTFQYLAGMAYRF